jgi:biotin-dependent carboxylase-like uncharacterized protein
MTALRIVEPGRATTIQDHGRSGFAHLGVPRAGAVDRVAHDLVNRLVGNPRDAATLETNGALVVEAIRPVVVATSDGHRHTLAGGQRLAVEPAPGTMWGYLAVRGGVIADRLLGSASHDTLSGIGPPPLVAGSDLMVGPDSGSELVTDFAPVRRRSRIVRLWPGPRIEIPGAFDRLLAGEWIVSSAVSRVGVRLEAATFPAPSTHTRASEPLVEGAIQVTPAGQPIVMLANHPTTGGYPVVAVVEPDDLGTIAQARPGARLRFVRA